ncbi:hypothetical protein Tco_1102894 [Tanacetum coccineum]
MGKVGTSPLMKHTSEIRQLAYNVSSLNTKDIFPSASMAVQLLKYNIKKKEFQFSVINASSTMVATAQRNHKYNVVQQYPNRPDTSTNILNVNANIRSKTPINHLVNGSRKKVALHFMFRALGVVFGYCFVDEGNWKS